MASGFAEAATLKYVQRLLQEQRQANVAIAQRLDALLAEQRETNRLLRISLGQLPPDG